MRPVEVIRVFLSRITFVVDIEKLGSGICQVRAAEMGNDAKYMDG
jgi:hypothetical protein